MGQENIEANGPKARSRAAAGYPTRLVRVSGMVVAIVLSAVTAASIHNTFAPSYTVAYLWTVANMILVCMGVDAWVHCGSDNNESSVTAGQKGKE